MIRVDQSDALRSRYVAAINAYSEVSAVIIEKLAAGQTPTETEFQREEKARAVLEEARREYFASRNPV